MYKCEICGKINKSRWKANRHMSYHLKEFKISCDLCDKKFIEKINLERHLTTHTKERPHACNNKRCTKTFKTKHHLKRHIKKKHGPIFKIIKVNKEDQLNIN